MPVATYQHQIDLEKILFDESTRQRKLGDLSDLKRSIKKIGLLHPIIISRVNRTLLAGGHRLAAYKELSTEWLAENPEADQKKNPFSKIPFRYFEEISTLEAKLVELDENLKRNQMTWTETALSILQMHELCSEMDGENKGTLSDTATRIGASENYVSNYIRVGRALREQNDAEILKCTGITAAINYLERKTQRQIDDALGAMFSAGGPAKVAVQPAAPAKQIALDELEEMEEPEYPTETPNTSFLVHNLDFITWAEKYNGPHFSLIHCDFPYGINFESHQGQNSAVGKERYEDSFETYEALCGALAGNIDRLLGFAGHIMFWFSMDHYEWTVNFFEKNISGLVVDRFPLIWTRNKSICPAPNYGPRRGYETALLMNRNRRMVVKPVMNVITDNSPGLTDHASAKPVPVLIHFFRMLLDSSGTLLDPTAGGGSSILAAKLAGAKEAVGLEINPEFAKRANSAIQIGASLSNVG